MEGAPSHVDTFDYKPKLPALNGQSMPKARTFAKLAFKGGAKLDQIQLSLGHASIQTTERYLGVQQDLTDAPCDYLHLKVE